MASFQKYTTKKDGTMWLYKYYTGEIDPVKGTKKSSTKRGFKTKKEAALDAAKTEQEIEAGLFIPADKTITFEQLYDLWFETVSSTYKPSTIKSVKSKFKKQILPRFGNIKIKDITKAYCQKVINDIAENINSVADTKMYINQVFEYGVKMDVINRNPLTGVVIPKKEKDHLSSDQENTRNYWEKAEIKTFLDVVKNECSFQDYVMFHLLIYTGGRKGEILALRWNDIDMKNKTMKLNKTLFHDEGMYMSLTSKTAASRRSISIDDTTLQLLKKLRSGHSEGPVINLATQTDHMIFTRLDGTPIRLAYPNDKLDEIITNHKLHSITVHGLRHTHASLLFEAGASIKEVQERLGHSDIKMTMNIYTHVTKTVKEKTAARFESFMNL